MKARGFDPLGKLAAELARVWDDTNTPRRITWMIPLGAGSKIPAPAHASKHFLVGNPPPAEHA
jgi:hypothetical protein